jgi:class III poly(R)-hydroxyalkanoic acid synthase PhaE subunit
MFDPGSDWSPAAFLKAWNNYVAASQAVSERLNHPNAMSGLPAPLPMFEAWQDFANALGMQSDLKSGGTFDFGALIGNLAPALGWNREYQLIVQRMLELGAEFQRQYAAFAKQGADIGEQALKATQRRIASNPQLANSPAAAYEAWIDSAETAYSQAAHSESFSSSLGELCNLVSAFKLERGKLLDAVARHLDVPTRSEVDSLHRQVRDLHVAFRAAASAPTAGKSKARASRKPADK